MINTGRIVEGMLLCCKNIFYDNHAPNVQSDNSIGKYKIFQRFFFPVKNYINYDTCDLGTDYLLKDYYYLTRLKV